MNRLSRWIALSALSLAVIPFVSGCGESESGKQIKETSTTTSYAQPAPIVATPPSTISTTEEKSSSQSTEMGNNSTAESTNVYHSEQTTVTPAPAPMPPAMQSQTTEKKTYKETTDSRD